MESASKFYSRIANCFVAHENCCKSGNNEWANKHIQTIEELVENYLPHGSGFDSGTEFIWDESNRNKLVFATAFHHMNEGGYYDGWSEHKVIVTPDLLFGFNIKITGRNRNDIKEYIAQCFNDFKYKE
jgi:hypothetical protein